MNLICSIYLRREGCREGVAVEEYAIYLREKGAEAGAWWRELAP